MSSPKYNLNNPSIKRIMREVKEMEKDPSPDFTAHPLEDNLFEWHFTIRGPKDTPFEGGIYHGRIILPAEYPFKPPNIVLLTPNGRFEVGKKICLSISAYHPEHWQPSWSIRTVLIALIGFMPTKGDGAIGALDYPAEERKKLARKSLEFVCERCGIKNSEILPIIEQSDEEFSTTTTTTSTQENETEESVTSQQTSFQTNLSESLTEGENTKNEMEVLPQQMELDSSNQPEIIPESPQKELEEDTHGKEERKEESIHAPSSSSAPSVEVSNGQNSGLMDKAIISIVVLIVALLLRKIIAA